MTETKIAGYLQGYLPKTAAKKTILTPEEIYSEWEEFEMGDGALSGKARLDRIRELEVQEAEGRASMTPDERKAEGKRWKAVSKKAKPILDRLYAAGNAEAFMQDKTRLKYMFFGPKVTKKVWGVDMLGQRMDPDYFMPDYKPKGSMVRTEGPDPLNRYHPSVHDAPIGMVYY